MNELPVNSSNSSLTRWLITITVMLVAVIEVIDITIVNVSLPKMMGSLGANFEEITWILTSYIVSAAIFMPLTGFLVNRLGRKRLLLLNIIGFMLSSLLCGLSTSLAEIVFFRTLQGIFGASLVPLSQFILRDTFPREEQGKAMAIWGIGIMAGPILGPTLGGYITDVLDWPWIFFINVPICLLAFFMTLNLIKETPILKPKIDWLGMGLMAIGIGALQIFLDRGNIDDWFESRSILILFSVFIFCLSSFIIRGWKLKKSNIINLHLFKDFNFSISTFLLTLFGTLLFGILSLQPTMMINTMGYNAKVTGLIMAPRGIASAIGMAVVAQTIKRFDPRLIISFGLISAAYGTYLMSQFNLITDSYTLIISAIIQGFGMGLFFVPLSVLAFDTLDPRDTAEAAGLFSFGRSLGTSIGISLCSTFVTRQSQIQWNNLGSQIHPFNPNLTTWLTKNPGIPHTTTLFQLAKQLNLQANMLAFINAYWIIAMGFIIMFPFIFSMQKPKTLKTDLGVD